MKIWVFVIIKEEDKSFEVKDSFHKQIIYYIGNLIVVEIIVNIEKIFEIVVVNMVNFTRLYRREFMEKLKVLHLVKVCKNMLCTSTN